MVKTDLEPALYDIGSGLSCSYDNINYYLKGVYLRKRETGFVEFSKVDSKWISYLFSVNFKIMKKVVETTPVVTLSTESSVSVDKHLFGAFYKKANGLYGECPYNAQRKFVSFKFCQEDYETSNVCLLGYCSTARTYWRSKLQRILLASHGLEAIYEISSLRSYFDRAKCGVDFSYMCCD